MSSSLDLLRFLALSTGVHAEAVECAADRAERVLLQIATDDAKLEQLEAALQHAHTMEKRMNSMRSVMQEAVELRAPRTGAQRSSLPPSRATAGSERQPVSRSRSQGISGRGSKVPQDPRATSRARAPVPSTVDSSPIADTLRFASKAEPVEVAGSGSQNAVIIQMNPPVHSRPAAPEDPHASAQHDNDSAFYWQGQVAQLRSQLLTAEESSVKSKLRRLEQLKAQVAALNESLREAASPNPSIGSFADALMRRHVASFKFTEDVEALWAVPSASDTPDQDAPHRAHEASDPRHIFASLTEAGNPWYEPQRSRYAADARQRPSPSRLPLAVSPATVDLFLARACQRFSGRCADALSSIAAYDFSAVDVFAPAPPALRERPGLAFGESFRESRRSRAGSSHFHTEGRAESIEADMQIDGGVVTPLPSGDGMSASDLSTTSLAEVAPGPHRVTAAQLRGALLYAQHFLSAAASPDMALVKGLQSMESGALADHFSQASLQATFLVVMAAAKSSQLLSEHECCVLPSDWPAAGAIVGTTGECTERGSTVSLLPPVRHILSQRFSYADVGELKHLEQCRLEYQRKAVDQFVRLDASLHDVLPHSRQATTAEHIAKIRVIASTLSNSERPLWETVAHDPHHRP